MLWYRVLSFYYHGYLLASSFVRKNFMPLMPEEGAIICDI
jgi:hypothetical protein